ncbi:MAG TPA: hypothetical protein VG318_01625 [Actinomycetota bacterium]|nr:hypothetical protein [Actinomycetota bacterium]
MRHSRTAARVAAAAMVLASLSPTTALAEEEPDLPATDPAVGVAMESNEQTFWTAFDLVFGTSLPQLIALDPEFPVGVPEGTNWEVMTISPAVGTGVATNAAWYCELKSNNPHYSRTYREVHARGTQQCSAPVQRLYISGSLRMHHWYGTDEWYRNHPKAGPTWNNYVVVPGACAGKHNYTLVNYHKVTWGPGYEPSENMTANENIVDCP